MVGGWTGWGGGPDSAGIACTRELGLAGACTHAFALLGSWQGHAPHTSTLRPPSCPPVPSMHWLWPTGRAWCRQAGPGAHDAAPATAGACWGQVQPHVHQALPVSSPALCLCCTYTHMPCKPAWVFAPASRAAQPASARCSPLTTLLTQHNDAPLLRSWRWAMWCRWPAPAWRAGAAARRRRRWRA